MAIRQIDEPDFTTMFDNAANAMNGSQKINNKVSFLLGYYGLGFTNLDKVDAASEIMAGSGLEANGVFYEVDRNYSPTGSGLYLYFTGTGFLWNDKKPSWNAVKRGWYYQNDRCVMKKNFPSKYLMNTQGVEGGDQASNSLTPPEMGSEETMVMKAATPGYHSVLCLPGWYRWKGVGGGGKGGDGGKGGSTSSTGAGVPTGAGDGGGGAAGGGGGSAGGGGGSAKASGAGGGGGGQGALATKEFYIWNTEYITLKCPGPGDFASISVQGLLETSNAGRPGTTTASGARGDDGKISSGYDGGRGGAGAPGHLSELGNGYGGSSGGDGGDTSGWDGGKGGAGGAGYGGGGGGGGGGAGGMIGGAGGKGGGGYSGVSVLYRLT